MDQKWQDFFNEQQNQDYFKQLQERIEKDEQESLVFPISKNRYKAFDLTPYDNVKVVIIGQDPYHEIGQAQGLAFSVPTDFPLPPSLRNIFKELQDDLGVNHFNNGSLEGWAKQGVFLINSILTVSAGKALSHQNYGWEIFFENTIKYLNQRDVPIIFVLWGKKAQQASKWIDSSKHIIMMSNHPSPLSAYRGFFGSKPFSQIDSYLDKLYGEIIDWSK